MYPFNREHGLFGLPGIARLTWPGKMNRLKWTGFAAEKQEYG